MNNMVSNYTAYIKNKTIETDKVGYNIPLLFSPDAISESINSSYDQQNIPGRSAPIISYSYTGARQLSISFLVTPDHVPIGYSSIQQYINALKALEYPKYDNGIVSSPNCEVHLPGIDLDGVCTSVSIEYKSDRYTRNNSMAANVSLSFLEIQGTIKGSIEIINNTAANSGGITGEYNDFNTGIIEDVGSQLYFELTGEGLSYSSPKYYKLYLSESGSVYATPANVDTAVDYSYTVKNLEGSVYATFTFEGTEYKKVNLSQGQSMASYLISKEFRDMLVNKGHLGKVSIYVEYYVTNKDGQIVSSSRKIRYLDVDVY